MQKVEIEMVGVDEFRNQDQARKCCETAQKNLERINKFFIPTIILSVISPIVIQAAWTCSMHWLATALFIANVVIQCYSGAIKYLGKYMTAPTRALGALGLIINFFWLCVATTMMFFFPIALVWYAKRICTITIESTKDIVA